MKIRLYDMNVYRDVLAWFQKVLATSSNISIEVLAESARSTSGRGNEPERRLRSILRARALHKILRDRKAAGIYIVPKEV